MKAVPCAWQRHAGGGLRLGERGREVARDPHHLAGRAHLRAEHRVGAVEAVERQHRLLDRDVLAIAEPLPAGGQAEVGDPLAEHDPAGELRQRHADRLGDERHRARGARVGLDHEQLPGVDGVLHVQQPDDPDRERDLARGLADLLEHLLAERVRRQHAGAVARVHAGLLDVLHDPADPHGLAVAERVDVDLDRVLEEVVEEDRPAGTEPAEPSESLRGSPRGSCSGSRRSDQRRPTRGAGSRRGPRGSRRSPSPGHRARRRGARAAGSRPRRSSPRPPPPSARSRTAAPGSRAAPAARRSARGPRPGRSRRRSCPAAARPPAPIRPRASAESARRTARSRPSVSRPRRPRARPPK